MELEFVVRNVRKSVQQAVHQRTRLVLLVGPPGSGKTKTIVELRSVCGWPFINLGIALAEVLQGVAVRRRPRVVDRALKELVDEVDGDTVLLDNIELLFLSQLHLDPLRALQGLARNKTVVAAWPGQHDDGVLTYANATHSERRRYPDPDAIIVGQ